MKRTRIINAVSAVNSIVKSCKNQLLNATYFKQFGMNLHFRAVLILSYNFMMFSIFLLATIMML